MTRRRFGPAALRRLALATTLLSAVTVTNASAAETLASIYQPFTTSGKPAGHVLRTVKGSCFSGSGAVAHSGAWRCSSGNELFDPCFSSPAAKRIVVCPATGPWSPNLVELKLGKPLPVKFANHGGPSTRGLPWALETSTGARCRLDTGATTAIGKNRLNYSCTGTHKGLWGSPVRTAEPWTIFIAPDTASVLKAKVGIRIAWF